jgi:Histidine phosphatase superfamily (branch 2)
VAKIKNFTSAHPSAQFKGPLEFLNSWTYQLGEDLLTAPGSSTEFTAGVRFWKQYGRLLYNATAGQPRYNASSVKRKNPVLRTTSQARILQSAEYWATGFFGFNSSDSYDLLIIPEGGTENNTLASYDSCPNDGNSSIYYIGDYAAVSRTSIQEKHRFRPFQDQLYSSLS